MKTALILGLGMLVAGSDLAPDVAQAQQTGSKRTDLQRHDLSAPGREVIQVRVDFDPGYPLRLLRCKVRLYPFLVHGGTIVFIRA
jgi:hypothetical protein